MWGRGNNVFTSPLSLLFVFPISHNLEPLRRGSRSPLLAYLISLRLQLCRRRAMGICICLHCCEWVVLTAALSSLVPGYIVTAAPAASLHGDSGDSPTRPSISKQLPPLQVRTSPGPYFIFKGEKAITIFNLPWVS